MDRKELVLLVRSEAEIAREKTDEAPKKMVQGFRKHDYPWLTEGDPHKDKYQRWVPDMPDLSAAAHALLKAREKTLEEKNTVDIKELRSELAKLGIVVRDEETRQYWRWQQTEEGVE